MNESLDINALSRETGINVRTIRYYLAEGLLPPPSGRGPAATYGAGHRDRLRLIRRLQDAHLPLAAIRTQLEALDDAGVAAALVEPQFLAEPEPVTAYDYVRQVLAKAKQPPGPAAGPSGTGPAPATPRSGQAPAPIAGLTPPLATGPAPAPRKPARSTWERIVLHPDIELHIRRPLARSDQRRLEELLEKAQRLFDVDT